MKGEIQGILGAFPEPVAMTDDEGRIIFFNSAAERLFGHTMSEAFRVPLARFFLEKEKERLIEALKALNRGEPVFLPKIYIAPYRMISFSAVSYCRSEEAERWHLFFFRDISRIASDKEAIKLLSMAIESIRDGVFFIDPSGTITYTNPVTEKIFNYHPDELIGKNFSTFFDPVDTPGLPDSIVSLTMSGGWWEGEVINTKKEGMEFTARLKTALLPDENGHPLYVVGIVRDVSEEVAMHREIVYTNQELRALYEVATTLSESIDLDELLSLSLEKVLKVTKMDLGLIRITDQVTGDLVIRAHHGLPEEFIRMHGRISKETSVSGIVLKTGVPHLSLRGEPDETKRALLMELGLYQVIVVPLRSKSSIFGTMSVGSYSPRHSSSQDLKLIASIGGLIGMSVENAVVFERVETLSREKDIKMQELTLLSDISRVLLTTIKLDRLLYIVLTAVTMGGSFGFNRAALLLVDEVENAIVGRLGLGPANADEAGKIWRELDEQKLTLFDLVEKGHEKHMSPDTIPNRAVRKICIPLDRVDDIVVRCVSENKPIIITDARTNPNIDRRLHTVLAGEEVFAIVPIVAMAKPLGAIIVDNVYNKKPITGEDLVLLSAFANQAGLAIQNSISYANQERINKELFDAQSKLLQQAKLVGLGEMAAEVAHEIRNPLVSIGGFARKISKASAEKKNLKKYSDIVIGEVEKLEAILANILAVPKDIPPKISSVSLAGIILNTVSLIHDELLAHAIELELMLEEHLPPIEADPSQLRQVFLNLFNNAIQAMEIGGKLTIKTTNEIIAETPYVRAEVSDTGKGIPNESIGIIFTPFYTTKKTGTGLGLTITHKIITNHGGSIDVINRPEGGATFIVELPVRQTVKDADVADRADKGES